MNQMQDMVAIITGASRGLGKAIALEFAGEGASVAICARANSPTGLTGTMDETAQAIRDAGGEVFPLVCDVTDDGQVQDMVRQVEEHYGRIDVLFNNAGAMVLGESILEIDPASWDRIMTVNVRGPYLCSRAVLPIMMRQRRRHAGAARDGRDRDVERAFGADLGNSRLYQRFTTDRLHSDLGHEILRIEVWDLYVID